MNPETYGLIPENPVRLNSEKAALGYLESLVTKNESYHILFHKLISFDFNVFDGKKTTPDKSIEIYQICTNDEKIYSVFIDIQSDECVWVPLAPFDFEYNIISICEREMTEESEAEYSFVQVDEKYVSQIRANWEVEDFDKYYPESIEHILCCNWGVNYKTNNFPYELLENYLKENTVRVSEMTEEQLEIRAKSLAEYELNEGGITEFNN